MEPFSSSGDQILQVAIKLDKFSILHALPAADAHMIRSGNAIGRQTFE
jgi:hypothetical protein